MGRSAALIVAGILLGTVGLTAVCAGVPSIQVLPHSRERRDPALPTSFGSPASLGVVVDTLSTTSDTLTPGNNASTLNQLGPNFLAYDPPAGKIFVSYDPSPDSSYGPGDAGGVAVINSSTGTVIGNIVDGIQPDDVLYDPNNGYVYAVDWRSSQVLVIDPAADTVLTTIDIGAASDPVAIALDPLNDHLFVTGSPTEQGVEVIDGSNNSIVGQLTAGLSPSWDIYDPANGELYVENGGGNNVSVFNASTGASVTSIQVTNSSATALGGPIGYAPSDGDLFVPVLDAGAAIVSGATNTVIGTIPPRNAPAGYWGFAFDPDYEGGVILATEWGGRNLTVINVTGSPSVVTTLPAGGGAAGILVAGSPAVVYVAAGAYGSPGSDRITRFNASTLAPRPPIQLGTMPGAEVYDPNTGCMDVALRDTGQVLPVNVTTGSVERGISVGAEPDSLTFDPVDGDVYVANLRSDNVSILGATGVIGTVPVGVAPSAVVADPASGDVYVANSGSATISVLAGESVVKSFPVEPNSGPDALAFDAATSRLFVVNNDLANVSEYDPTTGSLLGSFSVGADPVGITLDPGNQELYVLSNGNDSVNVRSSTALRSVANISVGDDPGAISFDPGNRIVYVANSGDNDLSAIDPSTDTVLGTLAVGLAPGGLGGLAPDGPLGSLYVANWLSGSVSVVATGSLAAEVQFGETGLPADSLWSVALNGSAAQTTGPDLTFYAENGTDAYAVAGPAGYTPDPASGTVRVGGHPVFVSVQFSPNSTLVHTAPAHGLFSSVSSFDLEAIGAAAGLTSMGLVGLARRRRQGSMDPEKAASPPDESGE
jgi:YVTN family beta-propeller protein